MTIETSLGWSGGTVRLAAYAPGLGRVYVVRSNSQTLMTKLVTWDPTHGQPRVVWLGRQWIGYTWSEVSDDGHVLAVLFPGIPRPEMELYDPTDGHSIVTWPLPGAADPTHEVAMSSDGRLVAVSPVEQDGGKLTLEVRRGRDGALVHRTIAVDNADSVDHAPRLAFSKDGSVLVYIRQRREIVRMDTRTGKDLGN